MALPLARELHPDVILLDYAKPGMDGADISRRLHADRATAAIPLSLMFAPSPTARVTCLGRLGRRAGGEGGAVHPSVTARLVLVLAVR
jgi:CheY-like chemotaxis protein